MIYIIGSTHRSGSSMMMRAIASSSSLTPVVSQSQEAIIRALEKDPEYDPNPHGYWQADEADYGIDPMTFQWIHKVAPNSLVKSQPYNLLRLHSGEYRVCLLERDHEQTRVSYIKAFGGYPPRVEDWPHEQSFHDLACVKQVLPMRRDVTLTQLRYEDIVSDPFTAFKQLEVDGWPIDPEKAATFVDPSLYRNRG